MIEIQPPKWARSFLRWYCREEYLEEIEGDLHELYYVRSRKSVRSANIFFVWNVLRSLRLVNIKKLESKSVTMKLLINYLRIYFRRFKKETSHYSVNIIGLSLGLTILFFILLFVHDEKSIDGYHENADRIYRVIEKGTTEQDGTRDFISTSPPLAAALKAEFPEIENAATMTYFGSSALKRGDVLFSERNYAVVDREIFNILDIEVVKGNPSAEFNSPAGVVLTESTAYKLFKNENPINEIVEMPNRFGNIPVLAVIKDFPYNSSHQFNALYIFNFDKLPEGYKEWFGSWDERGVTTWVLFKDKTSPESISHKKEQFIAKYLPKERQDEEKYDFYFQPINQIHLTSEDLVESGGEPLLSIPYSNNTFVSMILLMGVLVILIASLNYINLSSVQALKRTLEASVRKINGASNKQLIGQLFFEAFLTLIIAYMISWVLVIVLFPYFLAIIDKEIPKHLLVHKDILVYHLIIIPAIGIVSGVIPALYYSRLERSLHLIKNAFSGKGDLLRKSFVTIQYALSLFLIVASIIIYRQLNYVQSKDLGFENNRLITLDINSRAIRNNFKEIVNELKGDSKVEHASASSRVPGEWKTIPTVQFGVNLTDELLDGSHYAADQYWLDTYEINLAQGTNFSGNDARDSLSIIINKKTASSLNLTDPIGSNIWVIRRDSVKMKVIGVVEDFHFQSLYEPIRPIIITSWNNHVISVDYFTIKYQQDPSETISLVEKVHAKFDPNTPAEINFLDEKWKRFYEAEESRSTIILIASMVSIIISAFGLFGLINFTAERKTKEIGIRKVLGASIPQIFNLILKDYVLLMVVALVIAAPLSYWMLDQWLSDFAFRIPLGLDVFLFSFVIILVVSTSTVVSRVFKVAKSNPINSIRYE